MDPCKYHRVKSVPFLMVYVHVHSHSPVDNRNFDFNFSHSSFARLAKTAFSFLSFLTQIGSGESMWGFRSAKRKVHYFRTNEVINLKK
jgi:hypothetical protein